MAKQTKKEESILLRGVRIFPKTIYTVGDKRPSDGAPEIYKQLGAEKASAPAGVIGNIVGFPYVDGLWDTGLYPTSAIFREMGLNSEEAVSVCNTYRDFIITPLKAAGLNKLVEQLENYEDPNNPYFLNLKVFLSKDVQFNTGDARQRLNLFAAIISGELAPQGKPTKEERELGVMSEFDPVYNYAQYTIGSDTVKRTIKEQREYSNNKARGIFYTLLTADKQSLINILNYEGVPAAMENDEYAINQVVSKYFESFENIESFLETYEKSLTNPDFKEELKIMELLYNKKGLKHLEKDGRSYYLKGTDLGTNMKAVAKTLATNPNLTAEFYKSFELELTD